MPHFARAPLETLQTTHEGLCLRNGCQDEKTAWCRSCIGRFSRISYSTARLFTDECSLSVTFKANNSLLDKAHEWYLKDALGCCNSALPT